MSKMTISQLQTAMASYVAAAKIAGAWSASTNNFIGLLDKVGKQVTIDGLYNDRLPELEGDNLPLGKTIEEYFIDLVLPESWTSCATDGAYDLTPSLPAVEKVVYSYTLGREKVKTTVPYDNIERAMLNEGDAANAIVKITERLQNSYDLTRYFEKKQLLARFADAAIGTQTASGVYPNKINCAIPSDTETSENFIKKVKDLVEEASFAHEGGIGYVPAGQTYHKQALIGAVPAGSLVLYIKKGVMSSVEVDALAGAFNQEKLAIPCTVKVIDSLPTSNSNIYAVLCDNRGVKLHNSYNVTRMKENAEGDFINFVKHFEDTAFYSLYTFVKVFANE